MVAETTLLGRMIDFMATSPSPQEILNMKATSREEERIDHLAHLSKEGRISSVDQQELDAILMAQHLMIRAKAIAYGRIKSK
ncbi:MAG: hypothetical protein ACI81P_000325 [Neolewinella sp.]|jgi:hypothetical protein